MKYPLAILSPYKWLRMIIYTGLFLISCVLIIFALLQVPAVQKKLAETLNQTLSNEEIQFKITPIEGFFPFDIGFSELSLADKQGIWLKLENVRLIWSLERLLIGQIQVEQLSAERLWVNHLPASEKREEEDNDDIFKIPTLDFSLPIVNLGYLGINEIYLDEAVTGQALQLNFSSEIHTAVDNINAKLQIKSIGDDLFNLNVQAGLNLSEKKINANVGLHLAQLELLSALAGIKLSGIGQLTIAINGLLSKPLIDIKMKADNVVVDHFSTQAIHLNLQLEPLKTLIDKQFKVSLQGSANDLKQNNQALPDPTLSWQMQAVIDEKLWLYLDDFQLDGRWSHLQLAGFFDITEQQGEFDLQLNLDHLKALTTAVNANIQTTATIKIHPNIEKIEIGLDSQLLKLAGLDEPINRLLGKQINLKSQIEVIPEQSINIKSLTIDAEAINLQAKTLLNLKNQQLNTQLNASIPHFKVDEITLDQAKITVAVQGTTDKPTMNLTATLAQVSLQQQHLNTIKLQATAEDMIENLKGTVQLDLNYQQQPLALTSHYALQKQQLKLTELLINAPKTILKGDLAIDLSKTQIQGMLNARSDLTGLTPWIQQPMQGILTLDSEFNSVNGQQFIQLNSQLSHFKRAELTLAKLNLDAMVKDAFNKPHLDVKLQASDLKQQQTQLKTGAFKASGLLEQIELQLSVIGQHQQQPFDLTMDALLHLNEADTQLQLQQITGIVAKQAIKLTKASTLTIQPEKISLTPLSLLIGEAQLQGTVDYQAQKIAAQLQLALPLGLVNQFVEIPVNGQVNMQVDISGSAIQPQIDVAVNLNNVSFKNEGYEKYPATQAQLNAHIKQQRLYARVKVNNPQFKQPLQAQVEFPIQLQLEPFVFNLSEQSLLKGQISSALNLADIVKNIPFEGQQVAGDFDLQLALIGTVSQPQIKGTVRLNNGEYQNTATESHFKDIQLQIDAQPKQITLTTLHLNDTEAGSIHGKGSFSLTAENNYPFIGELNFIHAQLANSPNLKTHLSGGLKLKGNSQQALLSGQLSIDDFNLTLPSNNSENVIPELEIIEIGSDLPPMKQPLKIKKEPTDQALKIILDIGIKIANQFYIKGYGLDSEWLGDLSIKGNASTPKVLGSIETKRGSLEILNNSFVFRQGLIDFNGAYPPLPSVNIETVATVGTGEAIIRINGMADNLQLELSNSPYLPQDEIISNLLFGEDAQSISPLQALQLAQVVRLLAGGGLSSIDAMGSMQAGLGLDRLNLGGDSLDTASVKAGKYITDSIYLEVEQGLQSESSTATVELDLLSDIKAEIEFNQQSNSAVGIKWKHDY